MGMIQEFKEFAVKGNVIDMAVGIIIGAAFGKIVSSLVADIIMPPIGMAMQSVDFSSLVFVLKDADGKIPAVTINYGKFISAVIDFTIVAFALFMVIKQINRLKRKEDAPVTPTTKACPRCFLTIPIQATRCPECTSELSAV
jgi:large conductance mechanosensitive channel